jgi:hypothetical protein
VALVSMILDTFLKTYTLRFVYAKRLLYAFVYFKRSEYATLLCTLVSFCGRKKVTLCGKKSNKIQQYTT